VDAPDAQICANDGVSIARMTKADHRAHAIASVLDNAQVKRGGQSLDESQVGSSSFDPLESSPTSPEPPPRVTTGCGTADRRPIRSLRFRSADLCDVIEEHVNRDNAWQHASAKGATRLSKGRARILP